MRGVIVAGGHGTRLYPLTLSSSKQLLPVYDKPMIYYALSTLMLAGLKEIAIVCLKEEEDRFKQALKSSSDLGLSLEFFSQPQSRGIVDALLTVESFIDGHKVAMILGDNFFYESQLSKRLKNCVETLTGATVFAYPVKDPRQYGNIEFFGSGKIKAIHEKPVEAYSPYVVPGLYFYDETVLEKSSSLNLSPRGELEVTDLNNLYLAERSLGVEMLGRGCAWIDMGTHERLLEAGQFISGVEKCTGLKIACLEEVAYRNGYISTEKFRNLSEICPNSSYGEYLKMLANELCPPAKESAEPEQFTVAAAAADLLDFSAHP